MGSKFHITIVILALQLSVAVTLYGTESKHEQTQSQHHGKCGHFNSNLTDHKRRFHPSSGDFPSTVIINLEGQVWKDSSEEKEVFACGGTLISNYIILTSRGCDKMTKVKKMKIYADLLSAPTRANREDRNKYRLASTYCQLKGSKNDTNSDIGIVWLREGFENVPSACLMIGHDRGNQTECFRVAMKNDQSKDSKEASEFHIKLEALPMKRGKNGNFESLDPDVDHWRSPKHGFPILCKIDGKQHVVAGTSLRIENTKTNNNESQPNQVVYVDYHANRRKIKSLVLSHRKGVKDEAWMCKDLPMINY